MALTPPKTNIAPKYGHLSIGNTSSNHPFSVAMPVLGTVVITSWLGMALPVDGGFYAKWWAKLKPDNKRFTLKKGISLRSRHVVPGRWKKKLCKWNCLTSKRLNCWFLRTSTTSCREKKEGWWKMVESWGDLEIWRLIWQQDDEATKSSGRNAPPCWYIYL